MRAGLLLVAVAACLVVGALGHDDVPSATYYWKYPWTDAANRDIKHIDSKDVNVLKQACDSTPGCVGFNSNGWLKRALDNAEADSCDLYVKKDIPQPDAEGTIALLPWPLSAQNGSSTVVLSTSFTFQAKQQSSDLSHAFARYQRLMFPHKARAARADEQAKLAPHATLPGIIVDVANVNIPLQYGVDEGYKLVVPADGSTATLSAATVYGAYRGLETLSQLVQFNFNQHRYEVPFAPWTITDAPRFSHRGLLLDTSRHFESLDSIKNVIDSLAYAKMNVLHWHLSDSQSFPFESKLYPKLWDGAYSEYEKYEQEDVAEIVEYARLRGIRVMIEFDVPGHAGSWCTGYPNICPSLQCREPLNPATEDTFNLINGMFSEITGKQKGAGLFPDDFLHLGGDEVDPGCWEKTPSVAQWMKSKNFTSDNAYMYFVNRAAQITLGQQRTPVHWEEVFNHFGSKLDNRTVIHIWLDKATLKRVVTAGYRAILSDNDFWYLDHLETSWQQMYNNEPFSELPDPKQQALVLGGEVCMWGETVDGSDVQQTIWPRAAAAAERLWSARSQTDVLFMLPRLENFRCLLNRRGVAAAPTNNKVARSAPIAPGGCLWQ